VLKRNNITYLPDEIAEMKDLIRIDCSENQFSKLPQRVFEFAKIEYINFNMNQIENFDCPKVHKVLKYLFLTNNQFREIPIDVANLVSLKHLALDKNKIVDVDIEIFREYKNMEIQVTLSDNPLKIKANQKYLTKEKFDIKELPKENFEPDTEKAEKEKKEKEKKKKKKVNFGDISAAVTMKEGKQLNDDEKKGKKDFKFPEFHYKGAQNLFEHMINERIEEECFKSAKELDIAEEKLRIIKGRQIRFRAVKSFLINELIEKKNEGVIGKFSDMDLKMDMKEAYESYKKDKQVNVSNINETADTGLDAKTVNLDFNEHKVDPEFKKNYLKKVAENSNNLVFLKALSKNYLNKDQKIGSSRIRIYLNFLSNFDRNLYDNIKFFATSDEMDSSSFVMFLSELTMFLDDMIKYYVEHIRGGVELSYQVKVPSQSKLRRYYFIFKVGLQ
jgi:Leucine-rich repeat (LRR) protein